MNPPAHGKYVHMPKLAHLRNPTNYGNLVKLAEAALLVSNTSLSRRVSLFTGLDYWTGLLDSPKIA